jgi:hypothetical protein
MIVGLVIPAGTRVHVTLENLSPRPNRVRIIDRTSCAHPADQRWQGSASWQCCTCGRTFWGSKHETPTVDVDGRPA